MKKFLLAIQRITGRVVESTYEWASLGRQLEIVNGQWDAERKKNERLTMLNRTLRLRVTSLEKQFGTGVCDK